MDKTIHKKLSITEAVCVFVIALCMVICAMLFSYRISFIKDLLMLVVSLMEIAVISVELFLFHLETVKYKFITIAYFIIEVLVFMFMNALIPFSGLFVLILFSIARNVYRVTKVEEVYKLLGYYELCKKYGIKVKKPRKVRVTALKKTSVPVKKTKRSSTKEEPTFA